MQPLKVSFSPLLFFFSSSSYHHFVLLFSTHFFTTEINIWDEPNWGEYKLEECPTHSPNSPRASQSLASLSPSSSFSSSSSSSSSSQHFSISNSASTSSPALLVDKKPASLIASATLNKMLEHLTSPDAYGISFIIYWFITIIIVFCKKRFANI